MSCIVLTDSDEEIKFTSVPKADSGNDSDVIFCGIRSTVDNATCNRILSKFPINKDEITIRTTKLDKVTVVTPPEDDDSDVEFLGEIDNPSKNKVVSSSIPSRSRGARDRSDRLNININSQEPINTNLTIDIEENANSNQKKVQLTFLGPGNRGKSCTSGRARNFQPLSSSTPCAPKHLFDNRGRSNIPASKSTVGPSIKSGAVTTPNRVRSTDTNEIVKRIAATWVPNVNKQMDVSPLGSNKSVNKGTSNFNNLQKVSNTSLNQSVDDNGKPGLQKNDSGQRICTSSSNACKRVSIRENILSKPVTSTNEERTVTGVLNPLCNTKKNDKSGRVVDLLSTYRAEASKLDKKDKTSGNPMEASCSSFAPDRNRKETDKHSVHSMSKKIKDGDKSSKLYKSNEKNNREKSPSLFKQGRIRDRSRSPSRFKQSNTKETSPSISQSRNKRGRSPIPYISKKCKSRDKSSSPPTSRRSKSRNKSPTHSTSKVTYSSDHSSLPSTSKVCEKRSGSPVPSTSKGIKNRDKSPVPSTSKHTRREMSPILSSSGASQDDSASDSESCASHRSPRHHSPPFSEGSTGASISHVTTKLNLDNLFNKFLKLCTNASSKPEVMKFKKKMMKHYCSDVKSTLDNNDFIITLKEITTKMECKPVRCPLENMKKVLAELRRNSPDNVKMIKRLEDLLKAINKKIKNLEEAEVSSDEDECDNIYLRLDRYRKRAVQIYKKLCELNSVPADADRAVLRNVSFQASAPEVFSKSVSVQNLTTKVSHALEKYYNKSRKFPDFNDVMILMKKLATEGGYKLKLETIHQLGKGIFIEFGNMLQRRRLHDDYTICTEYLEDDDPALYDPVLAAKLDSNRKYWRKEHEILDVFCLKQVSLKEDGLSMDEGSKSQSSDDLSGDDYGMKKRSSLLREDSNGSDDNGISRHSKNKKMSDNDSSGDRDRFASKFNTKKRRRSYDETDKASSKSSRKIVEVSSDRSDLDSNGNDDGDKSKRNPSTISRSLTCSKNSDALENREHMVQEPNEHSEETEIDSSVVRGNFTFNYENASTICVDGEGGTNSDAAESSGVDTTNTAQGKNIDLITIDDESKDCNTSASNVAVNESIIVEDERDECAVVISENSEVKQDTVESGGSSICVITNVMSVADGVYDNPRFHCTDVTTCNPLEEGPISLVSDEEEDPNSNLLSQEDVMQIIPAILGSQ